MMGWSGVDLFFVLSGFLIGGILLEVRNSPSYFKTFYLRRFFRIIPIYYLWILAYIVLIAVAGRAVQAHSNSGILVKPNFTIYGHFLFLQNFMVVSFGGLAGAWFSHLWSLAVEEQFYLVSPLVIRFLAPRYLPKFLVAVIAGAPLLRIFLTYSAHCNPELVAKLMPCRADSLAVGMLAAVYWRTDGFREWLSANGSALYALLAVLSAGVFALWKWSPQGQTAGMETIGFTWLAFFYVTILLLALARPAGPVARCARLASLRELGRVSYCIYIIHLVVDALCHSIFRHAPPGTTNFSGVAVTILASFVTYGIAWISWNALEGPLVRKGHAYKYERAPVAVEVS
jgi:peptidoglycan/LPS O-acetylase OafA/YrhL